MKKNSRFFERSMRLLIAAITLSTPVSRPLAAEVASNPVDAALTSLTQTPDTLLAAAASDVPAAPEVEGSIPVSPSPEPEPTETRASGGSRLIEEIVVTAQKREENLQDVPISIAAFSGEQLDARGVDNVKSLSTAIPALQITDFAGYSLIYIRGIGTDSFFPSADSSVATYIDGVFFPSGHTLGEAFGKVKRVEVLKGPQGTLFGRNATGGAINIITEDPGFDVETSLKASFGRFNDLKTRAYTNIPLTDWLAVNVSGVYSRADSYYDRDAPIGTAAGESLTQDVTRAGRIKVRIAPTDDIDIVLSGIVSRASGPSSALSVNTMPSLVGSLLLIQPRDPALRHAERLGSAYQQRNRRLLRDLDLEVTRYRSQAGRQ